MPQITVATEVKPKVQRTKTIYCATYTIVGTKKIFNRKINNKM
jgi:hypothetical protein